MRYFFIVAAAGFGRRMNFSYPKQFLEYKGKPILVTTLEKINSSELVTDIIVTSSYEYLDRVKKLIDDNNLHKVVNVIEGGEKRQDSIFNAINSIDAEEAIVAIQDGVRPFIEEDYISSPYKMLTSSDGLDGIVVGVKVKDTIKLLNGDGNIMDTPDRTNIVAAQTPQTFKLSSLKKAYEQAYLDSFYGTDDAMIVEKYGGKIKFFPGSYKNIKITTQEDLIYLK